MAIPKKKYSYCLTSKYVGVLEAFSERACLKLVKKMREGYEISKSYGDSVEIQKDLSFYIIGKDGNMYQL